MRIIPAIDIIDGKCVRLTQGDYAQKIIYSEDPVEMAKSFEDAGLTHLHLIDLDGARNGKVTNWKVVENITRGTSLKVDFGGGIKTRDEVSRLLQAGILQVNLGSIAVREPDTVIAWMEEFGADRIILSADVKNELISINGWQDNSSINLVTFLRDYVNRGIVNVTCTDISTDGMLTGPNFELYEKLLLTFPQLIVIASGGVSCMEDLTELDRIGVDGVIVGKAIYEGKIRLDELKNL